MHGQMAAQFLNRSQSPWVVLPGPAEEKLAHCTYAPAPKMGGDVLPGVAGYALPINR